MVMTVSRGRFASVSLLALLTIESSCTKAPSPPEIFKMGDKVQTGTLIFTVIESKWVRQFGDGPMARLPANRFLVVHLSVVNGGAAIASIPALTLVDDHGQSYSESSEGQDLANRLGLIREVKPATSLEGNIVFDVAPKAYNLRVAEAIDDGKFALVELPLRFDLEKPLFEDHLQPDLQEPKPK